MKIKIAQHHLTEFLDCREKFNLKENYCIQGKSRKKQLDLGSAFHRGIASWKKTGNESEALSKATIFLDEIIVQDQTEANQIQIAKTTIFGMLNGYFRRYEEAKKSWQYLAIEKYLEVSLDRNIKLVGTPDSISIKGRKDKLELWLDEEKTTSAVLDTDKRSEYIEKLPLDTQVSFYTSLVKRAYSKYPLMGTIYRVTKTPTIRWKKGQTIDQYCKEIALLYIEQPDDYYYEIPVYRSERDLNIFEEELKQQVEDIRNCYKLGHWYRHPGACMKWGCEFQKYCINPTQETIDAWYVMAEEPKRCFKYINKEVFK